MWCLTDNNAERQIGRNFELNAQKDGVELNASSATRFKYIYGPVPPWRLGGSLGIDLLSQEEKIYSYDCLHCQLKKNKGCHRDTAVVCSGLRVFEGAGKVFS
jgi:hypothetical protein